MKKELVFLNRSGAELFRGETDSKKELVAETFRMHGYPWQESDPYEGSYHRWVPDHPDYSQHMNALLYARERALQKGEKVEAEALRRDLIKLGVMIQDEEKRQYVRMVS